MKPAPTMTTRLPGVTPAITRARLVERPEAVHAGPVGAGDRRLGRARAGRDQAVVELDGGAVVEGQCAACHVEAARPGGRACGLTFQAASEAGVAV